MVGYVGISYLDVVKHASLPTVISYISLVYIVHLEALKLDLPSLTHSGSPRPFSQRILGAVRGFVCTGLLAAAVYFGLGWTKAFFGQATIYVTLIRFLVALIPLLTIASKYPDLDLDDPNQSIVTLSNAKETIRTGLYFLFPVMVLVWCLMIERLFPGLSAFWATLGMFFILITQRAIKALLRKEGANLVNATTQGLGDLVDGLIAGARNKIGIAVATGTAGIIVGTISLTGARQVTGEFVEFLSGASLILMLVFVAILSLILGMRLPTTATYIVIPSLMVPVIVTVGVKPGFVVPLIAEHMFVFYFGILADDTPLLA